MTASTGAILPRRPTGPASSWRWSRGTRRCTSRSSGSWPWPAESAAALHHYEICRRMLAKELGVEPQPATQALVDRIRRGEPNLASPSRPGTQGAAAGRAHDPPGQGATAAAPAGLPGPRRRARTGGCAPGRPRLPPDHHAGTGGHGQDPARRRGRAQPGRCTSPTASGLWTWRR